MEGNKGGCPRALLSSTLSLSFQQSFLKAKPNTNTTKTASQIRLLLKVYLFSYSISTLYSFKTCLLFSKITVSLFFTSSLDLVHSPPLGIQDCCFSVCIVLLIRGCLDKVSYSLKFFFLSFCLPNSTDLRGFEVKVASYSFWSFLDIVPELLRAAFREDREAISCILPSFLPIQLVMKQSHHVMPQSTMWLLTSAQINIGLGSVGQTLTPAVFSSHSLGRCSNLMRLTTS